MFKFKALLGARMMNAGCPEISTQANGLLLYQAMQLNSDDIGVSQE